MQNDTQHHTVTVGNISIDETKREVVVDGKLVRLTPNEARCIYFLAINADTVCTIRQIVSYVWGPSYTENASMLVTTTVRHLRQKIETDPRNPVRILAIPDVGYKLVSYDINEAKRKFSTNADV